MEQIKQERDFQTLENLSKTQIASIKRAYASNKQFYTKKSKLEEKKSNIQQQIEELDKAIAAWDYPVIEMTGFTAQEVMDYLDNPSSFLVVEESLTDNEESQVEEQSTLTDFPL